MHVHDAVSLLLLALGAFAIPLGAGRIGIPGAVGEIIYGIIIGPHLLGLVYKDKLTTFLGELGFALLMFIVGLEIDFAHIERQKRRSLVVGAVIGGLTWSAIGPKDATLDTPFAVDPESGGDLRTQNDRLEAELSSLKVKLNRKKLAKAEVKPTPDEKKAVAKKSTSAIGVTFADERFQETLASIDWDAVGVSMKDMIPLLAKLAEAVANGETPDLAVAGEIQKLNGELLIAAQKIMDGNIPGTGVNGSWTHPVVVANQFGAALKAAGFELSKEQEDSLDRAMKFYSAKDQSLRLAEGDKEFKLEVLAEEATFKAAFYKEARGMLTEEQQKALFSEHTSGRGGFDPFDSSLMLMKYARPLRVKNAADLASKLSRKFSSLKIDAGSKDRLDAILARWSNELSADFWSNKADALDKKGAMSSARVRNALQRHTALMREIFANVNLTAADRAEMQRSLRFLVPLPR